MKFKFMFNDVMKIPVDIGRTVYIELKVFGLKIFFCVVVLE